MTRIFISYSHVDEPFAEALAKLLRDYYGFNNVWYDERLHAGVLWWEEILRQIDACDVFLYQFRSNMSHKTANRSPFNSSPSQRIGIIPALE